MSKAQINLTKPIVLQEPKPDVTIRQVQCVTFMQPAFIFLNYHSKLNADESLDIVLKDNFVEITSIQHKETVLVPLSNVQSMHLK